MRDELYDRDYQLGREALNDGIDRLVVRVGDGLATTFAALHRMEWSAPWHQKRDRTGVA